MYKSIMSNPNKEALEKTRKGFTKGTPKPENSGIKKGQKFFKTIFKEFMLRPIPLEMLPKDFTKVFKAYGEIGVLTGQDAIAIRTMQLALKQDGIKHLELLIKLINPESLSENLSNDLRNIIVLPPKEIKDYEIVSDNDSIEKQ